MIRQLCVEYRKFLRERIANDELDKITRRRRKLQKTKIRRPIFHVAS